MGQKRILIASDLHLCHAVWYGVSSEERMEIFVEAVVRQHERAPLDAICLLGDYSLDFWEWLEKGSYLEKGVSNARRFAQEYLPRLERLAPVYLIPGNHEQYGEEAWQSIMHRPRRQTALLGDWLLILEDTFRGNLDPTVHSDGTYTGVDVDYVREQMEQYPHARCLLMAHHLDPLREGEAFRALLAQGRIRYLFSGHVHTSDLCHAFSLPLQHTGQFSYGKAGEDEWCFLVAKLGDGVGVERIEVKRPPCAPAAQ